MKTIFLSFNFGERDRPLVARVERLLASHDVVAVTGRRLEGEALTPAIQERIDGCDGLIALLTRRQQIVDAGWTTHPWVRDELNYARNQGKRTIAVIEEEVDPGGSFGENEWLPLVHDQPADALLALSETIGLWKRRAGRQLKIQILPESVAQHAALALDELTCRYRFVTNGEISDWREARQIPEPGGTFIYVTGIQDDALIQLRFEHGGASWQSPAMSAQSLPVELRQLGGV